MKIGKIAIIGSGALGGYYGGMLYNAGKNVHFLFNTDYDYVKKNGLKINSRGKQIHLHPPLYKSVEDMGFVSLILIGLKATSNHLLQSLLSPIIQPETIIVTLQNGLGIEELLADLFPDSIIIGGTAFLCSNRTAPGQIQHLGYGQVALSNYQNTTNEDLIETRQQFIDVKVNCKIVHDFKVMKWKKLVWNVGFNVLSIALGGKTVKEILEDQTSRDRSRRLMLEIIRGAQMQGITVEDSLADEMLMASEKMGDYYTSMTLDFKAGRPLEIEAILLKPMERIRAAGGKVWELEKLYDDVRKHYSVG